MITQAQAVPTLLKACPSFEVANAEELIYTILGSFAEHLLGRFKEGKTEDFPAVAQAVERLLVEGDRDTRELAIVGILESIQNVWGNNGVDPEQFLRYLGPEGTWYWQSLNDFWSGKVPFVGYRG